MRAIDARNWHRTVSTARSSTGRAGLHAHAAAGHTADLAIKASIKKAARTAGKGKHAPPPINAPRINAPRAHKHAAPLADTDRLQRLLSQAGGSVQAVAGLWTAGDMAVANNCHRTDWHGAGCVLPAPPPPASAPRGLTPLQSVLPQAACRGRRRARTYPSAYDPAPAGPYCGPSAAGRWRGKSPRCGQTAPAPGRCVASG